MMLFGRFINAAKYNKGAQKDAVTFYTSYENKWHLWKRKIPLSLSIRYFHNCNKYTHIYFRLLHKP